MTDQKTEQKPDHEKRIREALEAGPTEGPWLIHDQKGRRWIETHSDDVIAQVYKDGRSNAVFEANSSLIAACNPAAIRALLADLDAARAALSEAKAGGWVAVPGAVYEDGGVSLIRRGTEDERCRNRGAVRLYAPLPAPPAQKEPT